MKEDKKINLNLPADYKGEPVVIVYREGTAAEINEPTPYENRNVSVASIVEYIGKKAWPEHVHDNNGLLVYSVDAANPRLMLYVDSHDSLADRLEAHLKAHADFTAFGINSGKTFDQKTLEKFVRTYAHCFEDVADVTAMIKNLQNFEARYEQIVTKGDDRQGAKEDIVKSAIKMVRGELPKVLKLRMPLYYMTPAVSFEVEVEVDKLQNNLPGFSFYSIDIELKRRQMAEDVIKEAVNKVQDKFAVLEV